MKILVAAILALCSVSLYAEEQFCRNRASNTQSLEPGFQVRFCFGSEEFMERFASALEDAEIPYVVYENGDIGYRSEDKSRVQDLGDELVKDYLSNRGRH